MMRVYFVLADYGRTLNKKELKMTKKHTKKEIIIKKKFF